MQFASNLIEIPRFDRSSARDLRNRVGEQEWLLLEMNLDHTRDIMLPEFIRLYLTVGGELDYEVYVVILGTPAQVIYRSDSRTQALIGRGADASVALFDVRPGPHTRQMRLGLRGFNTDQGVIQTGDAGGCQ
jgi:hypothetical protein